MRNAIFAITTVLLLYACGDKKPSLSGDQPVEAKDLVAAFPLLKLPFRVADSNMTRLADTTTISYKVFTTVVPDSVLRSLAGKNASRLQLHPLGRIELENELYLLGNMVLDKKTTLAVFVLDKQYAYQSSMMVLKQGQKDGYYHSVSVTSEPTFILNREKTGPKNETLYSRMGYAYNNGSGTFITVLNDTNEDAARTAEVINPIDTFPRMNKLSGDYVDDKRNFISIRDGSNPQKYLFYFHFDKNNSQCTGELKGEMRMINATHAVFQESGDPCVIDFTFNGNSIHIKEQGNCGNKRGIKCLIDETYRRKKVTVKKNQAQDKKS